MTCADTSSWIAFFQDADGDDVTMLEEHLQQRSLILSHVVVAELFSNPGFSEAQRRLIQYLPVLDLRPGFWQRARTTRADLLKRLSARSLLTRSSRNPASMPLCRYSPVIPISCPSSSTPA